MLIWIIKFIAHSFAHSAAVKKGLGIGASAGLLLGLAYASSVEYSNQQTDILRKEQAEKWAAHKERGDLILNNLNTTLEDLKTTTHTIDQRVYDLHKMQLDKKK